MVYYKDYRTRSEEKIKVCRPLPTNRRRGSYGFRSVAAKPWN